MGDDSHFFQLLVMAVVGGVALAGGLMKVAGRSALRARMRGGQRKLEDGAVVTLTGTARLIGEPMLAPLSGTPCVLHRSAARTYKPGLNRRHRVVDNEYVVIEMIEFVLETRDGPVTVTGDTADVTIRPGSIVPRQIEREAKFLRAAGENANPVACGFDEVVIEPGAKVVVHGVARMEIDHAANGELGFRDAATKTRLVGAPAHPLTIGE